MNTNTVAMTLGTAGVPAGWVGRRILTRTVLLRPVWCEVATAALWALAALRWNGVPHWWLPIPVLLGWFTVLLTATDLAQRRLPDIVNLAAYPAMGAAVLAATCVDASVGGRALLGVAAFGGVHLLVHLWRPAALGAGDVKLAGWLGGVLGAVGWPAMVFATVVAALCSLALRVAPAWRDGAPHGPGLLGATWLVALLPPATLFAHS